MDSPRERSILDGPRGRRLCLELAMELDPKIRTAVFQLGYDLDPEAGRSRVAFSFSSDDEAEDDAESRPDESAPDQTPEQLAVALGHLELALLTEKMAHAALAQSVDTARYWQAPDGEDVLAALPVIRAELTPLADHLAALPGVEWWARPRAAEQWAIDWRPVSEPAPASSNPKNTLASWARAVREEETTAAIERPVDPHANWSGSWWSIPPRGIMQTVGQIPAALDLVEDFPGFEHATTTPASGAGRTFEIRSADDWIALCRDFPLEVTASRRHDWFRVTSRDGRWVVPDWSRVGDRWDAVHLTVVGYLSSATRALYVDDTTATMIAGWDPDATFWLTDVARVWEGPLRAWHRGDNGFVPARVVPPTHARIVET